MLAWDRVSAGAGARVGMGLGHGWHMCLGWCWMGQWPSTGVRIGTEWVPALVGGVSAGTGARVGTGPAGVDGALLG